MTSLVFDPKLSSSVPRDAATIRPVTVPDGPLSSDELDRIHRYWSAANYLAAGQIYLVDNPLLQRAARCGAPQAAARSAIGAPRRDLNFIYVQLNRLIRQRGAEVALHRLAPATGVLPSRRRSIWKESTLRCDLHVPEDEAGMRRFFREFSTPGGIPSHAGPHSRFDPRRWRARVSCSTRSARCSRQSRAAGAACVIGDGEAETGPLARGLERATFLNPVRDGAVLPILHLNGYKIAESDGRRPGSRC